MADWYDEQIAPFRRFGWLDTWWYRAFLALQVFTGVWAITDHHFRSAAWSGAFVAINLWMVHAHRRACRTAEGRLA